VAEYLRSPGLTDQIIVSQYASVSVECATWEEWENEMLMAQSDQQSKVTGSGVGGIQIPGHGVKSRKQATRGK
jgi:hypothetical protein